MYLSQPGTSASAVWAAATRTLTSIAANMAGVHNISSSLGAGVVLDLRPTAGRFRALTLNPLSNVNISLGSYDGTTYQGAVVSANDYLSGFSDSGVGLAMKNTSAGSLNVCYNGYEFQ